MRTAMPSAFVIMPFGRKRGADGSPIDFDAVYEQYLKPALEAAGLHAHRADAEQRSGSIHEDMFQDLLLAEFVLADLTIDNPNVWYEIGVRHALRAGGVVMTYAARDRLPFDLAGQRMQRYTLLNGKPDPGCLDREREDLASAIRETRGTWRGHKASPVYAMMPYLQEPDWRTLKLGGVNEFWQALDVWQSRIEVAQLKQRPGDIIVLADETPNRILELEALRQAGKALNDLKRPRYAIKILDRALAIDPKDLRCRQLRAIALGRDRRFEEAREALRDLARESWDGETLGLLARSWKDEWSRLWTADPAFGTDKLAAARNTAATLAQAAQAYVAAFQQNPAEYYPGINALLLCTMWEHVTGWSDRFNVALLAGGLRWAVACALACAQDYWLLVTRAEQNLIEGNRDASLNSYADAAALAMANVRPFDVDSSLQTLAFLRDLGFRPDLVAEATEVMRNAERQLTHRLGPQFAKAAEPSRVILFSGHMVDRPDRLTPRFPEAKAKAAVDRIGAELDRFEVRPGDLGICQAASGGDLLFARACLGRGMRLEIYLPQREPDFLAASVSYAAPVWQEWFDGLKDAANVTFRVMPDEIGPAPEGVGTYDRCNRWMLYSALSCGLSRVSYLTLWDGQSGDGPGGTDNMVDIVRSLTGRKPVNIDPAGL